MFKIGERLDRYLQRKTGLSRKKVKSLLDQGRVSINGRKVVIASWTVTPEASIEIHETPGERNPAAGEHFLKVVYEDPDILVVDKDPGILCEPSPIATKPTLVEIINAYLKRRYPHLKGHYLGLVHRLDRDTSGLMVYTKRREANRLTQQFRRHAIGRRYLAVVSGPVDRESGKIEGFLKKNPLLKGGRKVQGSTRASGQYAVTHWRLIERYPNASLLEVTLNTGRTHQIRVHMAGMGHPLLGDRVYGGGGTTRFHRQALHASYLSFHHPMTGEEKEFRSKLPKDMQKLVDKLRSSV